MTVSVPIEPGCEFEVISPVIEGEFQQRGEKYIDPDRHFRWRGVIFISVKAAGPPSRPAPAPCTPCRSSAPAAGCA
jgi:hypothetical protein